MKKAVVLLSGGVDSSTTLAIAKAEGYRLYALTFDYGQRHARELESAKTVASALGAEGHLVIAFDLREIGGTALTSEMEVPKTKSEFGNRNVGARSSRPQTGRETLPLRQAQAIPQSAIRIPHSTIPVTYVPARNTIFLSFALAWAEVLEAPDIFIGANAVDYSGYPDCRPEYLKAFEDMANLATRVSVEGRLRFRIHAPLIAMTKGAIIKKGVELGFDYSLTWSCYDPQPQIVRKNKSAKVQKPGGAEKEGYGTSALQRFRAYKPCGKCDSCVFRAKGFSEAGIADPLL